MKKILLIFCLFMLTGLGCGSTSKEGADNDNPEIPPQIEVPIITSQDISLLSGDNE